MGFRKIGKVAVASNECDVLELTINYLRMKVTINITKRHTTFLFCFVLLIFSHSPPQSLSPILLIIPILMGFTAENLKLNFGLNK